MSALKSNICPGFKRSRQNRYYLPTIGFDLWVIACSKAGRLNGLIKWPEYLIEPSSSYLSFDIPVHSTPTHRQILETFVGCDDPQSYYFPIPFERFYLIKDIGSGVTILAAEYLVHRTFGWRDSARWLTPGEIATGRQRDDGIPPRSRRSVLSYVLCIRSMLLDEGRSEFPGWAAKMGEQQYIIKERVTAQRKPLMSRSEAQTAQSASLTAQNTPRSANSTCTKKNPIRTGTPLPDIQQAAV